MFYSKNDRNDLNIFSFHIDIKRTFHLRTKLLKMHNEKDIHKLIRLFPTKQYQSLENNDERLNSLLFRIDTFEAQKCKKDSNQEHSSKGKVWIDTVNRWIFGAPVEKFRYASVVALTIIALQTAMIVSDSNPKQEETYDTYKLASGKKDLSASYQLSGANYIISFNENSTISQIESLLNQFGAKIATLDNESSSFFTVNFSRALTEEKLAQLNNHTLIEFIGATE